MRTWGIGRPKGNDAGACSLDGTGQIWWPVREDALDAGGAHGTGSTASPWLLGHMDAP